ncbi:MAG: NADPH-dependent F420 reductase [Chloroflexi bacterium]|nr:NADPH-dependent F420 reductase [Chloroflexota bacterium]
MSELATIAILGGTGNEGPGLAMRWAAAGYEVIIGSRKAEKAALIAADLNQKLDIGTIVGMQNSEAARSAEICVLTVKATAHQAAIESLREELQGKIFVDATARVEFKNIAPPEPPSAGRIAQDILGSGVRVVAAFQNVPSSLLKKNLDQPVKTDVLVCADDVDAAEVVIELAEIGGMRAFYAGDLDNGIVVEGLTALLISMNKHYGGHGTIQVVGLEK